MFARFKWQMSMNNESHLLDKFRFCPVCGSPRFEVNDFKSKRCPDCGLVYYTNPCASCVAVILNERDELLVVRRACEPAKGTLDLPGGFCDCGESVEESVVREVKEETGLDAEVDAFLFSLPNIYPYGGLEVHTLDMFFLCRVRSGKDLCADDDASEATWIPWSEIKPGEFGLCSIRKGVEALLSKKPV